MKLIALIKYKLEDQWIVRHKCQPVSMRDTRIFIGVEILLRCEIKIYFAASIKLV